MDLDTTIGPMRRAGFALHWLHPREKRPIGDDWQQRPVATLADLEKSYRDGNNLGVRLGEFSRVGSGYLHVLDLDIRNADEADECWERLAELFPGVDFDTMPEVQSGSGGESRHLYFITDRPFRSKKLAYSGRKFVGSDGKVHWTWEIELFGTLKQVAMPPSIHPDTGQPYIWLVPFPLDLLAIGIEPFIPSADIASLGAPESNTEADANAPAKPPLGLSHDEILKILADLPQADFCDDRDGWLQLGMALHHETSGSDDGLKLWRDYSKQSDKYDGKDLVRVWKSFRERRGNPVRMATIAQAAGAARMRSMFDDDDDEAVVTTPAPAGPSLAALLGDTEIDPIDAIGTALVTTPAAEIDPTDAIGTEAAIHDPSALDWTSLVDYNEEGAVKPTLHNLQLIVANDPRTRGIAAYNQFTQEVVLRRAPGIRKNRREGAKPTKQLSGTVWGVNDVVNGDLWSDAHDNGIRSILEAPKTQGGYGIKVSDRDLKAGVNLSAQESGFHPVREYLSGLTWDGLTRVPNLFRTFLGAPDTAYSRSVSTLIMVAGVVRVFEPGHKFDFAVILEGLQGKRKSTFIEVLGRHWFSTLDGDFSDPKQMVELMQGAWILEIPELTQFGQADVRQIKSFISRQTDKVRLAYEHRAKNYPRQCIFIGSTNDDTYLRDNTGGRRFWPIKCDLPDGVEIDTDLLEREADQMWAEAVQMYLAMRKVQPYGTLPLYLADEEAKRQAEVLQESRRVETADDTLSGQIGAWLDKPVVDSSGFDDTDAGQPARQRNYTCLIEIWTDGLKRDRHSYDGKNAQMMGRAMALLKGQWGVTRRKMTFGDLGQQRTYVRLDAAGNEMVLLD